MFGFGDCTPLLRTLCWCEREGLPAWFLSQAPTVHLRKFSGTSPTGHRERRVSARVRRIYRQGMNWIAQRGGLRESPAEAMLSGKDGRDDTR
jgi:hypothetical protein